MFQTASPTAGWQEAIRRALGCWGLPGVLGSTSPRRWHAPKLALLPSSDVTHPVCLLEAGSLEVLRKAPKKVGTITRAPVPGLGVHRQASSRIPAGVRLVRENPLLSQRCMSQLPVQMPGQGKRLV